MSETWKDICGYEGVYQVSNTGKVRRLTFTNNQITKFKVHEIRPTDNGNGYLIVGLKVNGKRKNHYVHRLVAEAFCNRTLETAVVNHKDYNKYNNSANNLEWCTQKQNISYSASRMRHEKQKCRATNTGEKYITQTVSGSFKVSIKKLHIYHSFKNLEDAIAYRERVMRGGL